MKMKNARQMETYTSKKCRECGDVLLVGLNWYISQLKCQNNICIACHRKQIAKWYLNNKDRHRVSTENSRLLRKYGLTRTQRDAMLSDQDNKCSICGRPYKLIVDHNHITGKVRGMLCKVCNRNLGWLEQYEKVINSYLQ